MKGHTLHILSVEEGCLQITFQIPAFVKNAIFPLSHEQKKQLERLHIQKIDCDGVQFNAPVLVSQMVRLGCFESIIISLNCYNINQTLEFEPPPKKSLSSVHMTSTGMPVSLILMVKAHQSYTTHDYFYLADFFQILLYSQ